MDQVGAVANAPDFAVFAQRAVEIVGRIGEKRIDQGVIAQRLEVRRPTQAEEKHTHHDLHAEQQQRQPPRHALLQPSQNLFDHSLCLCCVVC
ncbi:MAG: hypothetical protein R2873_21995 [Caldilineaceae bacterium]